MHSGSWHQCDVEVAVFAAAPRFTPTFFSLSTPCTLRQVRATLAAAAAAVGDPDQLSISGCKNIFNNGAAGINNIEMQEATCHSVPPRSPTLPPLHLPQQSWHVLGRTTSSAIKILRCPLQSQSVCIYIMPDSDSPLPGGSPAPPWLWQDRFGNFTRSAHVCSTTLCNPSRRAATGVANPKRSSQNTLTASSFSSGLNVLRKLAVLASSSCCCFRSLRLEHELVTVKNSLKAATS